MKKGDAVYCIKDYISSGKIINTKGQIYQIISVSKSIINVNTNYKNDKLCNRNEFILESSTPLYNLYNYFIELKINRKEKLEKINSL